MPALFYGCYILSMQSRNLISLLLATACGLNSFEATAIEMGVSADLMYFNYAEFDTSGETLNTEIGFLPGITVSAVHPFRAINNTFEFSLYDGRVDYDGQTQSGQPHQTET